MTPTPPSPGQLLEYLGEQLRFLGRSMRYVLEGDYAEAKRVASTLRTLLHDTGSSHSLFKQLGWMERVPMLDLRGSAAIGIETDQGERIPAGVSLAVVSGSPPKWVPPFNSTGRPRLTMPVHGWWTAQVFPDLPWADEITRKSLVLELANRGGGSHVDPRGIREIYARFAADGLNTTMIFDAPLGRFARDWSELGDRIYPAGDAAAVSVVQVAWEVLMSLHESGLCPDQVNPVLG